MRNITLSSPLTGAEFECKIDPIGNILTENKLTGERVRLKYDAENDYLMLDARQFNHVKLITMSQAAKIIGVTRQRISQLSETLGGIRIYDRVYFRESDIIAYADDRKAGK